MRAPGRLGRVEGSVAGVLVLGTGNPLLADDGTGARAALRLLEPTAGRDDATVLDAGTRSCSLAPALRNADGLIAIDASRDGGRPGELGVLEGEGVDRFVQRSGRGVHEVALADLLEPARRSGGLTEQQVLIGVEPEVVD